MPSFAAICSALGLALAAALPLGASLSRARIALGALAGILIAAAWLASTDTTPLVAIAIAPLAAWACAQSGSFFDAVARREARGTPAGRPPTLIGIALLAGLAVAGASILFPPAALVALLALAVVAIRRRRAAAAKHAGLRILR